MRVAVLCGSLTSASANRAALDIATAWLVEHGATVADVHGLADVPAFRADLVDEPPAAVACMRTAFEDADSVLIAAPEYAGGLAGVVKNALDWMVGSGSLYRKPIAVLSAGTSGGEHAIDQLVQTLSWQGGFVVATLGIAAPRTKMDDGGRIVDPTTVHAIREWADALRTAHEGSPEDVRAQVAAVVATIGFDPARFGT